MEHRAPLGVHITRSGIVDIIESHNGPVVSNAAPCSQDILRSGLLAVVVFDKQVF